MRYSTSLTSASVTQRSASEEDDMIVVHFMDENTDDSANENESVDALSFVSDYPTKEPVMTSNEIVAKARSDAARARCKVLIIILFICVMFLAMALIGSWIGQHLIPGVKSTDTTTTSSTSASAPSPTQGQAYTTTSTSTGQSMDSYATYPTTFVPTEYVDMSAFAKPFGDIKLPLLDEKVLVPYASKEEFEADLRLVARYLVNEIILRNLRNMYDQQQYYSSYDDDSMMQAPAKESHKAGTGEVDGHTTGTNNQEQDGDEADHIKNDGTNNQEHDVYEADLIKRDDTYVYSAYGDYLVVWDRQGNVTAKLRMRPQDQSDDYNAGYTDYYGYIDSIQLTDTHVVLTMGTNLYSSLTSMGTHLRVYLKPTADQPSLTLVASNDIHGAFLDAKYLQETNSIHICTSGDFLLNDHFESPLDPYYFHQDQTSIGTSSIAMRMIHYYDEAIRKANDELIPTFVQDVTDFLTATNHGRFPTLMKMNSWATMNATSMPETYYFTAYGQTYIQVTSFKADELPDAPSDSILPVSTIVVLPPSSVSGQFDGSDIMWTTSYASGQLYATHDTLVLSVNGFEPNSSDQLGSFETLHLVLLKVNAADASASFYGLAPSIPGALPNKFALDISGSDLRVATTQRNWSPVDQTWAVCYSQDVCITEDNRDECVEVASICRNVTTEGGCPYTVFTCQDDPDTAAADSSTVNIVSVYDISQGGIMARRGAVKIGEPHEVITAVHFGQIFSYASTFDQRDPFYVLDLTAGQAPSISGTLVLEGAPSYLQPINDDATLLLSVGQGVSGVDHLVTTGLVITVFDVSNNASPVVVDSMAVDHTVETTTSSVAERDNRAVQYSKGLLVIPISTRPSYALVNSGEIEEAEDLSITYTAGDDLPGHDSTNFDGFIVLNVTNAGTDGISEILRISHYVSCDVNCYSDSLDIQRSFLYDDDSLMTMFNDRVVSTDLSTSKRQWTLTIEGRGPHCCSYSG